MTATTSQPTRSTSITRLPEKIYNTLSFYTPNTAAQLRNYLKLLHHRRNSNNTHNDNSFNVYIYLPNDYEQTTDITDIITLQLDSMRTA